MRYRTSILAACLGLFLPLMASEPAEAQDKKVTFLIHPTVYGNTGGPNGVIPAFVKRTGIQVEVVTQPIIQLHEKAMVEWIAGTGRYDVVTVLDNYFTDEMAQYLESLDPMIGKLPPSYEFGDIIPSLFDAVRVGGKTYGMPFQGGVVMLFYRKDLFDRYQVAVPRTLDDLLTAARKVSAGLRRDGNTETYALGVRAKEANVGAQDFLVFHFAAGGNLFEDNKARCALNGPAGVAAARLYADLVKEGLVPKDLLAFGRDELIGAFQQGRLAMAAAFSTYYAQFNDPKNSKVSGHVGWTVMPTAAGVPAGRTFKTFWYNMLDKHSRNKDAAWAFMQEMAAKEPQIRMASAWGFGPARASAFASPDVQKMFPHAQDWGRAAAASVSVPHHPEWPKIQDIVFEEHATVLAGRQAPERAVARMCERIQPLLKR
ncbi:MAG TPA: sugar ABC transporter substrate-binding protein [Methylomirabilota bacterium]|jgi:multiple sugar transport system substrate-binding protein|nr:sugar ABC transporter substrate-binding protein [Methylomirabilota bacterium]